MKHELITHALRIRRIEETFLELFAQGKLNGTVHTCIGQEFSALAFAGALRSGDAVVSNHRCHGHYLAFTKDTHGLMAELMGRESGTCGGVGSSQHLCHDGFYSNGIQGGTLPVAAGLAMGRKLSGSDSIVVVYMGDGTLGEGAVYEAMNMASKWKLPLLIVCEHNRYAQSTPTERTIAGDISDRARAFGITTFQSTTNEPEALLTSAAASIELIRRTGRPVFHLVETHRLAPHSKGDDDRDPGEITACRLEDPICRFANDEPDVYAAILDEVEREIKQTVAAIENTPELTFDQYVPVCPPVQTGAWRAITPSTKRQVDLLHDCLAARMEEDPKTILLGEDIAAPYGGAFKVTRDLSDKFPDRVFSTPISEAGITGIANGLGLDGYRPILEIMFGDFVTLSLDQLINHASKFHHMYNRQVHCPLILRTPMGGGRGYGPTHSQSLDKFLAGIDTITLCALNSLVDPADIYAEVFALAHPAVVLEHKLDYGRRIGTRSIPGYEMEQTDSGWPIVRIRPQSSSPDVTIVTYGGMTDPIVTALEPLFMDHDIKVEVIIPSRICPLDIDPILASVRRTGRLVTVEEGSAFSGIGAEIVAQAVELAGIPITVKRIAAKPVPIPSIRNLEDHVLPTTASIIQTISEFMS